MLCQSTKQFSYQNVLKICFTCFSGHSTFFGKESLGFGVERGEINNGGGGKNEEAKLWDHWCELQTAVCCGHVEGPFIVAFPGIHTEPACGCAVSGDLCLRTERLLLGGVLPLIVLFCSMLQLKPEAQKVPWAHWMQQSV